MTQLKMARAGKITPQMEMVAKAESRPPRYIREMIKQGKGVILSNRLRWERLKSTTNNKSAKFICGIGAGLKTKVNANIGTSSDYADEKEEINKLRVAEKAGADAIMDLSTGGNIPRIRRVLIKKSRVAFGTVPIYEAVIPPAWDGSGASPQGRLRRQVASHKTQDTGRVYQAIREMSEDGLFRTIESHARDGVDFITVHAGVTRKVIKHLKRKKRVGGLVSRGGAILAEWMRSHHKENPLYEQFDRLLEIARAYDVTLSLGDGLRPGAIADSFDRAQVAELETLAKLARKARTADVQVIIEGPGHVPLHQVQDQVKLQKRLCKGAPFYVLGPIVTDIAPGYDHITSAIGGALAAWAGADFICYVTPMEHLGLPTAEHVREGVIAARIAAHAADIAKGVKGTWEKDKRFSGFRRKRNWEKQIALALDPTRARAFRRTRKSKSKDVCSMCGKLCVYRMH